MHRSHSSPVGMSPVDDAGHMPRLSTFYGVVIRVWINDHPPPHVHVHYGEFTATLDIERLEITHGRLPRRVRLMVLEWASEHRAELQVAFDLAHSGHRPTTIDPLT